MQKLDINNSKGEKLAGILYKAENSNKIIIVCHGRLCTKDSHFYPELCQKLHENGFNAYRFDFSGNGQGQGQFKESTISKDIEDIKSVVDFLKEKGFEIFCLIGHSQGSVEVLLHQAKYGSAKHIIDIAGVVDQENQTIRKYTPQQIQELESKGFFTILSDGQYFDISKEYFYDRYEYGDIRHKVMGIKVPVLVIHGTKDGDIDFVNGKMMHEAIEGSKFVPIEGAGHFFEDEGHRSQLIKNIVN